MNYILVEVQRAIVFALTDCKISDSGKPISIQGGVKKTGKLIKGAARSVRFTV